jgi:hypothetical protein
MVDHLAYDSDVLWQDDDVCILKPETVGKGIVVYHAFPIEYADDIYKNGLILGAGFKITGTRSINHPYIFFRAPGRLVCPVSSVFPSVNEINANYYPNIGIKKDNSTRGFFCIRIDPDKTFVYSSECRANFYGTDNWKRSRKSLREFWDIIEENRTTVGPDAMYNLYTYIKCLYGTNYSKDLTVAPPEYNSEILVRRNIPAEWMVHYHYE